MAEKMMHTGDFQIRGRDENGRAYGRWFEGCHQPIAPTSARPVTCECNQIVTRIWHHEKGCGKGTIKTTSYAHVNCSRCRKQLQI